VYTGENVAAIFYLLLIANLSLGIFCVVFLLSAPMEPHDPGARTLVYPFFPLMGITMLQMVDYYLGHGVTGPAFTAIHILYDLALVTIAFSWNYIAIVHYRLNGADQTRHPGGRSIAVVSFLLAVALVIAHLRAEEAVLALHAATMVLLFYAGIKGVRIRWKVETLYPSSRTAVLIAAVSLVTYPAIAVGDALGWSLLFLDEEITFWAQAHPLYVTAITIPLLGYTYHHRTWGGGAGVPGLAVRPAGNTGPVASLATELTPVAIPGSGAAPVARVASETVRTSSDAGDPVSPGTVFPTDEITRHLTPRENQVLVLLYEGYRYREIAQMLFVSLTTVRTHIHHIYEKLGISRKEELFVRVRNTRNAAATADTPESTSVLIRRSSSE